MGTRCRDDRDVIERYFSGQAEGVSLTMAEAIFSVVDKCLTDWRQRVQDGQEQPQQPHPEKPKVQRAGKGPRQPRQRRQPQESKKYVGQHNPDIKATFPANKQAQLDSFAEETAAAD